MLFLCYIPQNSWGVFVPMKASFLVLGCVLLAAVFVYAGGKESTAQTQVQSPVTQSIQQSPEEVEKYWTPERMRNAQPMPMPSVDGGPVPMPSVDLEIPPGEAMCTQEAMACPDGSYVSRTGPNCEFAPCPGSEGSAVDGSVSGYSGNGGPGYSEGSMGEASEGEPGFAPGAAAPGGGM